MIIALLPSVVATVCRIFPLLKSINLIVLSLDAVTSISSVKLQLTEFMRPASCINLGYHKLVLPK
mgnify:CR=1 FL=1